MCKTQTAYPVLISSLHDQVDPVTTLQQITASDYDCRLCACHAAGDTLNPPVCHVL